MDTVYKSDIVPEYLRKATLRNREGVLDAPPPWPYQSLFPLLSSRVRIDDEVARKIIDLAKAGPIVYAMKHPSLYDLHFLRVRFAQLGLPAPAFVFEMSSAVGSVAKFFSVWAKRVSGMWRERQFLASFDEEVLKQIFSQGGAAVMFLVDEKAAHTRFIHPEHDPIRRLLDLQGNIGGCISIVPMMVLCDRAQRPSRGSVWERLLGDPDRPGALGRIHTALRKWMVPELLVGEPVQLRGQCEGLGPDKPREELPIEVRKELIASINVRIRVNRGPEKLSPAEIKERVLQDPRVQKAVCELVAEEGLPEAKVRKKAEAYVDEIANKTSIHMYHFLYVTLQRIFSRIFSGIDVKENQFAALKQANMGGTLVFVSCHKSHFDYLLVGVLCFMNNMAIPLMAAGQNLAFWPVGPILRHGAAFFLRRTFKGLRMYGEVFAAYVKGLVKDHTNIKFFIEGGRSRTGKLLPPKVGLLGFLLQAIDEKAVPDLAFVPTFVGYDQIPEEKSFLKELSGKEKSKETFLDLIQARKILSQCYGRVYLRFHDPISFTEFRKKWKSAIGSASANVGSRQLLNDFANYLMRGIAKAGVVTHIELAAAGLVCHGKRRVSRTDFLDAVGCFSDALSKQKIDFDDRLADRDKALDNALAGFSARGFVKAEDLGNTTDPHGYVIETKTKGNLEFYKNSLVNTLWHVSLLGVALAGRGPEVSHTSDVIKEDFRFLADLLSQEVILDPLSTIDDAMEQAVRFFSESGWLQSDHGRLQASRLAPVEYFRGVLADLLLVYYVVLAAAEHIPAGGMNQKDFVKDLAKVAAEISADDANLGAPSLPSVTVNNALAKLAETGILDYDQSQKVLKSVKNMEKLRETRQTLARSLRGRINGPT
jgi:glycerol-3-phosphate O-acyltransferase